MHRTGENFKVARVEFSTLSLAAFVILQRKRMECVQPLLELKTRPRGYKSSAVQGGGGERDAGGREGGVAATVEKSFQSRRRRFPERRNHQKRKEKKEKVLLFRLVYTCDFVVRLCTPAQFGNAVKRMF